MKFSENFGIDNSNFNFASNLVCFIGIYGFKFDDLTIPMFGERFGNITVPSSGHLKNFELRMN